MSDNIDKLSDAAFDWVHCAESAAHDLAGPAERENRQHARESFYAALRVVDAELAEAKRDAVRYRWLRDSGDHTWKCFRCTWALPSDECDKLIDAAIALKA